MKTVTEYAEMFRAEYPCRYAVAFGQLEGTLMAGDDLAKDAGGDLVEQLRRLREAMNLVERDDA
jgi:hypothetical protein